MSEFPVKVFSHKRSGTHFLLCSLWLTFDLPDASSPGDLPGQWWYSNGESQVADIPWHKLRGTHEWLCDTSRRWPVGRMLYIVRNPLSCLHSLWRFEGGGQTLDEFVNHDRVRHWYLHANEYTSACRWVRYEDLVTRFDDTLQDIQRWFGIVPRGSYYRRPDQLVGWSPGEAKLSYADEYEDETIKRVRQIIPSGFCGYTI